MTSLALAAERRSIRAQVHTHPGAAYHSRTDDHYPIVAAPGLLSLVIPRFALGPVGLAGAHLAELQADGSWVLGRSGAGAGDHMSWREEALDRTLLLVAQEVFPGLERREIAAQLLGTHVRLSADAATLGTPAGQTALVSAFVLVAELGAQVILDVPGDVGPQGVQPPLGPAPLRDELAALAADTISPLAGKSRDVLDLEICFGETAATGEARLALFCQGTDWSCRLGAEPSGAFSGEQPFGGVLSGIAVAAETFRAAMRALGERQGLTAVTADAVRETRPVELALPALAFGGAEDLGRVDVISAGAIATSSLYTLLRVPGLRGALRVIDEDRYALTNLNRYVLMRRFMVGQTKARALAAWSNERIEIESIVARFDDGLAEALGGLAPRVLVGVNNIRSRWAAQSACPGWLGVTGTDRFTVVDSGHEPEGPCAGCLHWRDDDDPGGGEIPTVSFVSVLAGLLQAYRLLAAHTGAEWAAQVVASPLNLSSRHPLMQLGLSADARCGVGCAASRELETLTPK